MTGQRPVMPQGGHFMANCTKPNVVQLSQAKQQKTIEAANELVIDLTNDSELAIVEYLSTAD